MSTGMAADEAERQDDGKTTLTATLVCFQGRKKKGNGGREEWINEYLSEAFGSCHNGFVKELRLGGQMSPCGHSVAVSWDSPAFWKVLKTTKIKWKWLISNLICSYNLKRSKFFLCLRVRTWKQLGVQVYGATGLRRLYSYIMRAFTLMGETWLVSSVYINGWWE